MGRQARVRQSKRTALQSSLLNLLEQADPTPLDSASMASTLKVSEGRAYMDLRSLMHEGLTRLSLDGWGLA